MTNKRTVKFERVVVPAMLEKSQKLFMDVFNIS